MEANRTDLQLFIDLGFILLAAFFLLTEQAPRLQVPLPGEEESAMPVDDTPTLYAVHFDERMQVVVLRQPEQTLFCSSMTIAQLQACLQGVHAETPNSLLMLSPQGHATLQQLVSLLDLCLAQGWECTIAGQA